MRHDNRNPRRPITPANSSRGLSSAVNRDFVLQIFAHSTPEEIEAILQKARFRLKQDAGGGLTTSQRAAAVEQAAAAFLRTTEGASLKVQKTQELLKQMITEWFKGPDGQQTLLKVKANLLAGRLAKDPDVITGACRQALVTHVDKWLRSPLGEAQIEEEKKRVSKQQVAAVSPAPKVATWTQRHIEGVKDA